MTTKSIIRVAISAFFVLCASLADAAEVSAPLVDTGQYVFSSVTSLNEHLGTPEVHQINMMGNNGDGSFSVNRRAYWIFNLFDVKPPIISATLRVWCAAPSDINNNSGCFHSSDTSETVELHSVESNAAFHVMDAPFDPELDILPIWEDLGGNVGLGTTDRVYGSRNFTVADDTDHFVDFLLTPAAIEDLNAGALVNDADVPDNNWWIIGGMVVGPFGNGTKEQIFAGSQYDGAGIGIPIPQLIVEIEVPLPNAAPVCQALTITVTAGAQGSALVDCTDINVDPLIISLVELPVNGSAGLSGNLISYSPNPGFTGIDSFTYKANDGSLDSNIATVNVSVKNTPFCQDITITTIEGKAGAVDPDCADVDGDPLTFSIVARPTNGIATGRFTYSPDPGFTGIDVFTYKASDDSTDSNTATVNVIVSALPEPTGGGGVNFTLVSDEENTKDMSVNFSTEDFLEDGNPNPSAAIANITIDRDTTLNHDSGVLDVHFNQNTTLQPHSRSLIQFLTLKKELEERGWTKENREQLRAHLRLFIIPPYGPRAHYRLLGQTPVWNPNIPPFDLNPVPPSMPIAVFRQTTPWVEGNGQGSYFAATHDVPHFLDLRQAGVVARPGIDDWKDLNADGTVKEFDYSPPADVCLNRQQGLEAENRDDPGRLYLLCYDDVPDSEYAPWMEWDVSEAVRFWLENGFDPALYHGLSIGQRPAELRSDAVRINDRASNGGRSSAVMSFASSSAAADCGAAGGFWGGPDEKDLSFGNTKCMTQVFDDLEPGLESLGVPRILTPVTRPEWRPQIVIHGGVDEALIASGGTDIDVEADGSDSSDVLKLRNFFNTKSIEIISFSLEGADADSFIVSENCLPSPIDAGSSCTESVTFEPERLGAHTAILSILYTVEGAPDLLTITHSLSGFGSEDDDGVSDAVEDQAPHNGDGNEDGIPDRQQGNVVSFKNNRGEIVTFSSPEGTLLKNARRADLTTSNELKDVAFDHDFYTITILEITEGGRVSARLYLPDDDANSYYKFGPTPENTEDHWYLFDFDGSTETGAKLDGNVVTLVFLDGGRGDADGDADGKITDPGGPGVTVSGAGFPAIDGQGTGDGFDPSGVKPTNPHVGAVGPVAILLGGMGLILLWAGRRRKQNN